MDEIIPGSTSKQDRRVSAMIFLLRSALPIWESAIDEEGIYYADSVVGVGHHLGRGLLSDVLALAERMYLPDEASVAVEHRKWDACKKKTLNHVVSLQDNDLELPSQAAWILMAMDSLMVFVEPGVKVHTTPFHSLEKCIASLRDVLVGNGLMDRMELESELNRILENEA